MNFHSDSIRIQVLANHLLAQKIYVEAMHRIPSLSDLSYFVLHGRTKNTMLVTSSLKKYRGNHTISPEFLLI